MKSTDTIEYMTVNAYTWSVKSSSRLDEVVPILQDALNFAVQFIDISIACGHRNEMKQKAAIASGNSKVDWPDSKHNKTPSEAVDVKPVEFKGDDKDLRSFYYLAGLVIAYCALKGVAVRWGGDWDRDGKFRDNKFDDLFHFEVVE